MLLAVAACSRIGAGARQDRRRRTRSRGGTLTASLRSEPPTFNRWRRPPQQAARRRRSTRLTQATLVRINRVTGEPEPWLAEKWTVVARRPHDHADPARRRARSPTACRSPPPTWCSPSRRSTTRRCKSVLASGVKVQHQPLHVTAPDPRTVVDHAAGAVRARRGAARQRPDLSEAPARGGARSEDLRARRGA